jgi:hypothetical protein
MISMTIGVPNIVLELQWTHGLYGTFTWTSDQNLTMICCPWGKFSRVPKCVPCFVEKEKYTGGIPCSHILRIMDKIEDNMVKIQHWKVYATHFGDDSELSRKLMDSRSLQQCNEGNGVPITNLLLSKCLTPPLG